MKSNPKEERLNMKNFEQRPKEKKNFKEKRLKAKEKLQVPIPQDPNPTEIERVKLKLLEEYSEVFSKAEGELPPMEGKAMRIELKEDAVPFAIHAAYTIS